MGSDASLSNGKENDGFSRLDLVKHSMRTIGAVLGEDDLVAIVEFHSNATIRMSP